MSGTRGPDERSVWLPIGSPSPFDFDLLKLWSPEMELPHDFLLVRAAASGADFLEVGRELGDVLTHLAPEHHYLRAARLGLRWRDGEVLMRATQRLGQLLDGYEKPTPAALWRVGQIESRHLWVEALVEDVAALWLSADFDSALIARAVDEALALARDREHRRRMGSVIRLRGQRGTGIAINLEAEGERIRVVRPI